MKITRECPMCRKSTTKDLNMTIDQYKRVGGSELIQNVVPHLSAENREFLITGYCDKCQSILFTSPEDEESEFDMEEKYNNG